VKQWALFVLCAVYAMSLRVAVVGAGVVGLSTAVQIQQVVPAGVKVTIIADKFTTETTSHGAAGIFRPVLSKTPGVPLALLKLVILFLSCFKFEYINMGREIDYT